MAVTISTLVNTDTFGDWKDKTNDLIDMAAKTLTIGEGETNSGNVEISGNVTVEQTLFVDTIQPYTAGPNTITITGTVTATSFSGNGSGLTSIPASQLTGTVAAARLTGTYSIDIDGGTIDGVVIGGSSRAAASVTDLTVRVADDTSAGSVIRMIHDSATPSNGDETGEILFREQDSAGTFRTFTRIRGIAEDVTSGAIEGSLLFYAYDNGTEYINMRLTQGGITLAHQGSTKLVTSATGVDVTGALSATSFVGDGSSLTGINTDLVADTTPQLGGTLASNGNDIQMADNDSVIFGSGGAGSDSQIYWNGSALKVDVNGGNLHIEMDGAANTDIVTITSGGANTFLFDASQGDLTVSGDITAFGTLSDITVKENISHIENALEKINNISGYTFNYKDNPNTRMTGVIAQEVQKILPEVIYKHGDHYAVRYNNMVGILVEAIKELSRKVDKIDGNNN